MCFVLLCCLSFCEDVPQLNLLVPICGLCLSGISGLSSSNSWLDVRSGILRPNSEVTVYVTAIPLAFPGLRTVAALQITVIPAKVQIVFKGGDAQGGNLYRY